MTKEGITPLPETETLDRLYLEWSQFTRARNSRELAMKEALVGTIASLAAAVSLLERTPQAKKAAPSNKMFAMMLDDYRKSLSAGRAALDGIREVGR